ncbi:AI-2E family transporter, partial [bacterium]
MAENPEAATAGQEPLPPPQAFDESEAVARDLTVPEVFVLITALLLLVALGRAVEQILSPFVLIGALLFILYPLRHNRLVSRLTVLGSIFFVLWFFYSILGRLTPFIIAFLLAYLLNPAVTWLEKKGIPRWASSLVAILLMVGGVVVLLLFAMPVVIQQFNDILKAIGRMVQDFADLLRSGRIFDFLARYGLPVEGARDVISHKISPRLESLLTALFGG